MQIMVLGGDRRMHPGLVVATVGDARRVALASGAQFDVARIWLVEDFPAEAFEADDPSWGGPTEGVAQGAWQKAFTTEVASSVGTAVVSSVRGGADVLRGAVLIEADVDPPLPGTIRYVTVNVRARSGPVRASVKTPGGLVRASTAVWGRPVSMGGPTAQQGRTVSMKLEAPPEGAAGVEYELIFGLGSTPAAAGG